MMEKEANRNHDEETATWAKTYRGTREDMDCYEEHTVNSGYISPSNTPSSGNGEEDVWLSKASNQIGIEPIYIDTDYVLDRDLTFSGDGFHVMADDIILDLNGHLITSRGGGDAVTHGVVVEGRTGVTVKNGIIKNCTYGIYLDGSSDTTLTGNTATENIPYGFYLSNSSGNTLTGNTATDNGAGFALSTSSGNTLTGNTATDNEYSGFWLLDSSDITLTGNTATDNGIGFALHNSSGNTLTGNTATGNSWTGFDSTGSSSGNTLTGNTATGNSWTGFNLLSSSGNTLTGNTATDNGGHGVVLAESDGNTLTGNTVTFNAEYGILMRDSSGNTIYNNYFDNDHNAYGAGTNAWNIAKTPGSNIIGGSYIGGNFWSDYNGTDADGDGLGDTSYAIPGDINRDDLPLFDPTRLGSFPIPGGVISLLLATLLLVIFPVRRGKRRSR